MRYIADTTEFQITEPTICNSGKFDRSGTGAIRSFCVP